ncbi:hypothetical protein ACIP1G_15970, partial [Pseudomonas sp. NPDC089392]|uniref:hypothetical protein n=1 Tax=Pseudomonas sp. NPDC089392 TaxID=3364459 RepID=UPI00382E2C18
MTVACCLKALERRFILGCSDKVSWLQGGCHNIFIAFEIERRPRGASQHKAAPTSVSGQSRL